MSNKFPRSRRRKKPVDKLQQVTGIHTLADIDALIDRLDARAAGGFIETTDDEVTGLAMAVEASYELLDQGTLSVDAQLLQARFSATVDRYNAAVTAFVEAQQRAAAEQAT
jgi:hypothetical protein